MAVATKRALGRRLIADEVLGKPPGASTSHTGTAVDADEACMKSPVCVQNSPAGKQSYADEACVASPAGVSFDRDALAPLIHQLQRIIKDRTGVVDTIRRIKQAVLARINSRLGGASRELFGDDHKLTREYLWAQAELVYRAAIGKVVKGLAPEFAAIPAQAATIIQCYEQAMKPLRDLRAELEKQAIELAKQMPGHDWWVAHPGLDSLGLAIVVGHSGAIHEFANRSCWLKRMSIAVIDGVRQGDVPAGAGAEVWIRHGYIKKRRAALYTIGTALFMRSTRVGGYWRKVYDARRKDRETREVYGAVGTPKTKGRYHRDAMRYMTVQLLRNYRVQWLLAVGTHEERDGSIWPRPGTTPFADEA